MHIISYTWYDVKIARARAAYSNVVNLYFSGKFEIIGQTYGVNTIFPPLTNRKKIYYILLFRFFFT